MSNRSQNLAAQRQVFNSGGEPMAALTAYSFPQAQALEKANLDWILVGDSGGMVELGYPNTRPVSLDQMLTMVEAVRKGAPTTFLVGDMPFGSYEESPERAVSSAIAFAKAGDVDAVKLEGGARIIRQVEAIVAAGISVMGHIGLTPQGVSSASPYRVVGRRGEEVQRLIEDAQALEGAGASSILLEAVPPAIADLVINAVDVTIFGIGSGPSTHGQLLILHDVVGLYPRFRPKFASNFAREVLTDPSALERLQMSDHPTIELIELSATRYCQAVRNRAFPDVAQTYDISASDLAGVRDFLSRGK